MLKKLKFILILIISMVITWYIAEGIYYLSVLLKPMTHMMAIIERIFLHIAFLILGVFGTILFTE
jgi:hypothetical protein